MSSQSFADLGVSRRVEAALAARGIVTPFAIQTLVISDGKDGGSPSGTVMTTYLATLLSTQGAKPSEPYERTRKAMYESSLSKDSADDSVSPPMPSGAKKDAKKST